MRRTGLIFLTFFIIFIYSLAQGSYSIEHPEARSISSGGYLFTEVVNDLLTVDIRDIALEKVLKQISDQNGITFFLPPSLGKEKVMVRFSNFKVDDGLKKILASYNHIFIYSEEDHNSHEPPITRLTEVRIYPRFKKANKKGTLEVTPVIHSKAPNHSLEKKDIGAKRYGMKESGESWGRKSVETLSKPMKNKNPRGRVIGNEKATGTLASAIKDKNHEMNKESEKALEKMGEDLKEGNDDGSPTDADEEEPISSDGGDPSFAIEYSNDSPEQGSQNLSKEIDIRLNDVTEQLIGAGFSITYDPSNVSIANVDVYDGSDLAGPWDRAMTNWQKDADGPGTYVVTCGNLNNVTPDSDSTINLAKVRFICKGNCNTPITISTIPGFTVGEGNSGHIYNPNIKPITVRLQ